MGPEGNQLGVLTSREALDMAREQGLDLVLVASTANPPVCKIIDYGKYKYLERKLGKDKKSKQQEIKGIKISPRIAMGDMEHNAHRAISFLKDGNKVRVVCMFKAREVSHPEIGRQKLDIFADKVKEFGTVEKIPSLDGKMMVMILNPKPGVKKNAKNQNVQDGGEAVQDHRHREDHAEEIAQQPPVPAQESQPEATA